MLLRLSNKSLTLASDDRMIHTRVPSISEYIGLRILVVAYILLSLLDHTRTPRPISGTASKVCLWESREVRIAVWILKVLLVPAAYQMEIA